MKDWDNDTAIIVIAPVALYLAKPAAFDKKALLGFAGATAAGAAVGAVFGKTKRGAALGAVAALAYLGLTHAAQD